MWQDILKVFVNEDIDEFVEELAVLYAEKYLNKIKQSKDLYGNTKTMIDKFDSMDDAQLGGNKTEYLRTLEKYPNTQFVIWEDNIFGIQNGKIIFYDGLQYVDKRNKERKAYAAMAGKPPSDAKQDVFDQSGFNPNLDSQLTNQIKTIYLIQIQKSLKDMEQSERISNLDAAVRSNLVYNYKATDKIAT